MITILTEKPRVGRDIARVLGATEKREGYMEGNGYLITWAYGHLVTLAIPEDYGIESYNIQSLPILPNPFMLKPRYCSTKKNEPDLSAKIQLGIIKSVFSKCHSIICATDAGREGELIFRYIYSYLNCKKPFSRLWINSMTDAAIQQGLSNLKPGKDYDNLYLSAEARSKADWIVGINASRALCISTGDQNNSLGRVQTPTLAYICKRYMENKNFQSQPYWQNSITLRKDEQLFAVKSSDSYFDKKEADVIFNRTKAYNEAKVTKVSRKEIKQDAPLLHDLTSLQKEANTKYGFSADKTLGIAQKLYESKVITYPRTGSRYIPDDVFDTIPMLMEHVKDVPEFKNYASRLAGLNLNAKPVNAKKVTDHHALLPTDVVADNLSKEQSQVYHLIVSRMLEAFSGPCIKDVTEVEICCKDIVFVAKGWTIKEKGWREVLGDDTDENNKEENQQLPSLNKGDSLPIESYNMVQKSTKAKPLYTDATLLSAMESTGKEIGTPATRAAIIETLFKRGYIERDKKAIIPTQKGISLYGMVKDMQIADAELTAKWEASLAKIEKSPGYYSTFFDDLKNFTSNVVDEIVSIIRAEREYIETPYICPKCRLGKITIYQKLTKCNYSKCNFKLYRTICGIELSNEHIHSLFKTGKTGMIEGFVNKKAKPFNAAILLEKGGKLSFQFKEEKTE